MCSVQFRSVPQSCLTLCDPVDRRTPGVPVHHQHLELADVLLHVKHWAKCLAFKKNSQKVTVKIISYTTVIREDQEVILGKIYWWKVNLLSPTTTLSFSLFRPSLTHSRKHFQYVTLGWTPKHQKKLIPTPSCSGSERCLPSKNHNRTELCVCGSHPESKISVNKSRTWLFGGVTGTNNPALFYLYTIYSFEGEMIPL